jgi:hypothetical protein
MCILSRVLKLTVPRHSEVVRIFWSKDRVSGQYSYCGVDDNRDTVNRGNNKSTEEEDYYYRIQDTGSRSVSPWIGTVKPNTSAEYRPQTENMHTSSQ